MNIHSYGEQRANVRALSLYNNHDPNDIEPESCSLTTTYVPSLFTKCLHAHIHISSPSSNQPSSCFQKQQEPEDLFWQDCWRRPFAILPEHRPIWRPPSRGSLAFQWQRLPFDLKPDPKIAVFFSICTISLALASTRPILHRLNSDPADLESRS